MRSGLWKRFGWGFADQALSSLTNFGLSVLVATSVSTSDFGEFNLVFATYLLVLGVSRAFSTEPLIIRYSTGSHERWREAVRAATGTAVAISVAAGVFSMTYGVLAGGASRGEFVILGLAMPGLIVQDSWRFVFFSRGRGAHAFLNDLLWGILLLASVTAAHFLERRSVVLFVMCWGAAAAVACVFGAFQFRAIPRPDRFLQWWRAHRDLSVPLATQFMATSGMLQASLYGVAAVSDASVLGALRGGSVLLGPIHILIMGASVVAVPEGARALETSHRALKRLCLGVSGLVAGVALAWGLVANNLPDEVGRAVLGVTWDSAHPLIPAVTLSMAAAGLAVGATCGIRAMGAAKVSLRVGVTAAGITAVAAIGGAALGGATGSAWATAGAAFVGSILWWRFFSRALAEHARSTVPEESPAVSV
jgi:O-antigen/teichoic acid export membrane protein